MHILYIDDEKNARDKFASDYGQGDNFVETAENAQDMVERLSKRPPWKYPKLLVVDLYGRKPGQSKQQAKQIDLQVQTLANEITVRRNQLEIILRNHRDPTGYQFLKEIKNHWLFRFIPFVLRTREGFVTLDDKVFKETLKLKPEWSLKGRSVASEKVVFRQARRNTLEKRRLVAFSIVGTITVQILVALIVKYIF